MSGIITFKHLRELQKSEKMLKQDLQSLDAEFYSQIKDHIATIAKLSKKGSLKDQANLQHTTAVVRTIIDSRVRKTLESARLSIDGGSVSKNMLPPEKKLFDEVRDAVSDYKHSLSDILPFDESLDKDADDSDDTEPEESGDSDEPESKPSEDDADKSDIVVLDILDDIPCFVGSDMKEYGPYSKGQSAKLPRSSADILVKAGKAEEAKG